MATTANKNCKQFIGIVTGEDGITARSGDEPGKGTVKLQTVEINEDESTSEETVYQISETGSTDVEVYNYTGLAFSEGEKVEIWQDGYGVFWVTPTKISTEYFLINPGNDGTQTAVNDYSVYTKGSLHYIEYSNAYNAWIPANGNESTPHGVAHVRPAGTKLVVCQDDAPNSAAEFKMPYFTPESNMGVPAKISSYLTVDGKCRCGVLLGEHTFSDSMYDYSVTAHGGTPSIGLACSTYSYQPYFTVYLEAKGQVGGGNIVYVEINNIQIEVFITSQNYSMINSPDIYQNDPILVEIDCQSQTANPVWIPTDYEAGTLMAVYSAQGSPGRGWNAITTPQNLADAGFSLYQKVKTNAIL